MSGLVKIDGSIVELLPAPLNMRRLVYEWCFHSETTKSHFGPPDYPDRHLPNYAEFCRDYVDYYFTGEAPEKGQGFLISAQGVSHGFLSYAAFHLLPKMAEIDIWMHSEASCGKGYGTDALVALGDYLRDSVGLERLIIRPSKINYRAIRTYKKAGFMETETLPADCIADEFLAEYGDGDYGAGGDLLLMKWL